jgi:hypothetical protein
MIKTRQFALVIREVLEIFAFERCVMGTSIFIKRQAFGHARAGKHQKHRDCFHVSHKMPTTWSECRHLRRQVICLSCILGKMYSTLSLG